MNNRVLKRCRRHDWSWRFDSGDGWECRRCGARLDATGKKISFGEMVKLNTTFGKTIEARVGGPPRRIRSKRSGCKASVIKHI